MCLFITKMCWSVIKMVSKRACKSSTNFNSSLCQKQPIKGKKSARQSKPPTVPLIVMNDNDVSDER